MKLSEKKTKFPVLKICLLAFIAFLLTSSHTALAQQVLEGENYKIVVPSISSGGDFLTNEDGSLKMGTSVGDVFADPKLYSDLYMASARDSLFEPFIPDVACFETITDGESACTTGPEFLNVNGMVRACGPEGCYDRARFEIDANDNPIDTLYGIQISTDNFEEDIRYICGTTLMPKEEKTIGDFKTKANWETDALNILGLEPQTEYSIRITALFGDLTESAPSETKEATTAFGSMAFRIGLGYENGEDVNYNPPYEILFDESFKLIRGANVRNSDRLIWTLTNTNSVGGITIVQKGAYAGLYSAVEEYTLESVTANLDAVTEGIGLQNRVISQLYIPNEGGLLSSLVAKEEYNLGENNVGIIETLFKKIYESDGPIHTGRTALDIKAKASLTTPEGEYREDITFVLIAKY